MQKTCRNPWCKEQFEIANEDVEFYDKVSPILDGKKYSIPLPTRCPECRRQRRLSWRNERTLYHRACDLCKKTVVTVFSPECPNPVYCNPCWWDDTWDPFSFGLDIDPSRSFFDQYKELYSRVPQRAMVNDDGVTSENCAYCFDIAFAKNCYLCIGMWKMQDCYYSRICDQTRYIADCEGVKLGSELVYESLNSLRLYRSIFMQNSENCRDCAFGFDLKGCANCIGCVGLRQKQHCIFNEPYSKEDYEKKLAELQLNTHSGLERMKEKFFQWSMQFPRKDMNLQNCENSKGDHLFFCKDTLGFVCTNVQYSKYMERSDGPQWCYDIVQSGNPQWSLDSITGDESYMSAFSMYCNQSRYCFYSDNCLSCEALLGCISLRRKKYCIFNKQYSKDDYEKLAGSVLEEMQKRGEWGEFFPEHHSPYGYNETNAHEFFPLEEEEVKKRGLQWTSKLPFTTGKETIKALELPESIREVPDSILQDVLSCALCKRNYKIIQQELSFYRTMDLPIPRKCPDCRNIERLARQNPFRLWTRSCAKCGKSIETSYALDRPEIVYCEQCYLAATY